VAVPIQKLHPIKVAEVLRQIKAVAEAEAVVVVAVMYQPI
jgi:hypothetical protein